MTEIHLMRREPVPAGTRLGDLALALAARFAATALGTSRGADRFEYQVSAIGRPRSPSLMLDRVVVARPAHLAEARPVAPPSVPSEASWQLDRLKIFDITAQLQHGIERFRRCAVRETGGQFVPPLLKLVQ